MARLLRKMLIPYGPAISLSLLGLLLLSAVLYYRAVNIQRFLEPALAISRPRIEFAQKISELLEKEFGREMKGLLFTTDAIFVKEEQIFLGAHHKSKSEVIEKLSRVLLAALEDPELQSYVELIMVTARLPIGRDAESNKKNRPVAQHKAELVLSSIYKAEPRLRRYETYFVATALPVNAYKTQTSWVELRVVPTLRLHIDVLQKLQKYAL